MCFSKRLVNNKFRHVESRESGIMVIKGLLVSILGEESTKEAPALRRGGGGAGMQF